MDVGTKLKAAFCCTGTFHDTADSRVLYTMSLEPGKKNESLTLPETNTTSAADTIVFFYRSFIVANPDAVIHSRLHLEKQLMLAARPKTENCAEIFSLTKETTAIHIILFKMKNKH